jgi:hypothetical protein
MSTTELDPRRDPDHPSHRALEELAFDRPGTHDNSPLAAHVERCDACGEAVRALVEQRRTFLARRPAAAFVAGLERRHLRLSRWRWAPALGLAFATAAAAAGLLVAIRAPVAELPRSPEIALRGEAAFTLYVSRDGAPAVRQTAGAKLYPGDVLRFGLRLPGAGYVFIADLDDRGTFARYYPQAATATSSSGPGGVESARVELSPAESILPGSIRLDEFVGRERILLFFSTRPLSELAVSGALHAAFEKAGGDLARIDPGQIELDARVIAIDLQKAAR